MVTVGAKQQLKVWNVGCSIDNTSIYKNHRVWVHLIDSYPSSSNIASNVSKGDIENISKEFHVDQRFICVVRKNAHSPIVDLLIVWI